MEAGYKLVKGINLACVANVMLIQPAYSHLNEVKSNGTRIRSNACWKYGEIGHLHIDCIMFGSSSQNGDNNSTVTGQMMHTLTAISRITNMMLKSLFKELKNANGTKKAAGKDMRKSGQVWHHLLLFL